MDVQCERCKTDYLFDDALVSGRGTMVRCTTCGHQFRVRSSEASDPGSEQWLVHTGAGQRLAFASLRELQRAILTKQIVRSDVLLRGAGPWRDLGSIAELEPFFQGRASSRPPPPSAYDAVPPMRGSAHGRGVPEAPITFPKRSAQWIPDPTPAPFVARVPSQASMPHASSSRSVSYDAPPAGDRPKIDTLRPPPNASAAPPPPTRPEPFANVVSDDETRALLKDTDETRAVLRDDDESRALVRDDDLYERVGRPHDARLDASSVALSSQQALLPAPQPMAARPPMFSDDELPEMNTRMPSYPMEDDDLYAAPRRRRVGGWVVALVLLVASGVVGWAVAKPYMLARGAASVAPSSQTNPRAQEFAAEGERAMSDGNLDSAQEAFDKASALAEGDTHVLLDEARVAAAKADVPWLKLRLLPAEATDEARATKLQLDERLTRGRKAADTAAAAAPDDLAATRTKIDVLRLAGDREGARALVGRVTSQASQPETAYVLAALDLAEPNPLWPTVIDRLRVAAAGEGNGGRARAALVYALVRSGDLAGARSELARLDSLARPYPVLPNLHGFVEKSLGKSGVDGGAAFGVVPAESRSRGSAPSAAALGFGSGARTGEPAQGESLGGMQAAGRAIRAGDWNRARQIYEALVARNPNDSEALSGIADVDRAQGNLSGAVASYKRALGVNPSYLPALLGVADTEWASGDRASAQRAYKDIVDRFPEGTYPSYAKTRVEASQAQPAATPDPDGP